MMAAQGCVDGLQVAKVAAAVFCNDDAVLLAANSLFQLYVHVDASDLHRVLHHVGLTHEWQPGAKLEHTWKRVSEEGPDSWFEVHVENFCAGDDEAVLVTVRDIDEEHKLKERIEGILDTSFEGFFDWYITKDYEYMSPRFWEIFGYEPHEKEHKPSAWQDMIHPDDLKKAGETLQKHFASRGEFPYLLNVRYTHKNGSTVWVQCKGRVVEWGENGEPLRMIGTHTDITQLKRSIEEAEEANKILSKQREQIKTLHQELRYLIDKANTPIFAIDREGKVKEWNESMEKLTGRARSDVFGASLRDSLLSDENNIVFEEILENAEKGKDCKEVKVRILKGETNEAMSCQASSSTASTSQSDYATLVVNTTQRLNEEGGTFFLCNDVSRLLESQEQTVREVERANAEMRLNEFLAHEVRNPLGAAKASARFLREDAGSNPNIEADSSLFGDIAVVETSLSYIEELLTNLLDLNRAKQGIDLAPKPMSIRDNVIGPVVRMLRVRSIQVKVSTICKEQFFVEGDSLKLKQVVLNLASNALKFTTAGFVKLDCHRCEDDKGFLEISCSDSGPGIPFEHRKRIFQKYEQLETLNTRGSGIGLCLAREIVSAMGGTLTLDEEYLSGVDGSPGCRFIVRLPLPELGVRERQESANLTNSEQEVKLEALPETMRILVVDDDAIVRMCAVRRLRRICKSWEIFEAANGEEALQKIKNKETFEVILVDEFMGLSGGVLSGSETIAQLRKMGVESVIVGCSGNDRFSEHISSGANAFFTKPLPNDAAIVSSIANGFLQQYYFAESVHPVCGNEMASWMNKQLTEETKAEGSRMAI